METYEFEGQLYPEYLKKGRAEKYIEPIAKAFCKGKGLDIGGTREAHLPGARIINVIYPGEFVANWLPPHKYDYIFSSHTLEHLYKPADTLRYWATRLKPGGRIFLYLPHPDMTYWLPRNCTKHGQLLSSSEIVSILKSVGFFEILYSQRDLFWSFAITGKKGGEYESKRLHGNKRGVTGSPKIDI